MSVQGIARRIAPAVALAALVGVGMTAVPNHAQAWWRGGWGCCSVGIGIGIPPIVVAPPAYYAPPPVYYAPPPYYGYGQRAWIPGHWQGGYWVPPHWG